MTFVTSFLMLGHSWITACHDVKGHRANHWDFTAKQWHSVFFLHRSPQQAPKRGRQVTMLLCALRRMAPWHKCLRWKLLGMGAHAKSLQAFQISGRLPLRLMQDFLRLGNVERGTSLKVFVRKVANKKRRQGHSWWKMSTELFCEDGKCIFSETWQPLSAFKSQAPSLSHHVDTSLLSCWLCVL